MKPAALLVLLAACAMALGACRHPRRTPVERGQGVFLRSCAGCHGQDGRGAHPPGFSVPPRDLTTPELQARLSDGALRETIRYGKGQMPPFGASLLPEDVEDLVAFVRTLKR